VVLVQDVTAAMWYVVQVEGRSVRDQRVWIRDCRLLFPMWQWVLAMDVLGRLGDRIIPATRGIGHPRNNPQGGHT